MPNDEIAVLCSNSNIGETHEREFYAEEAAQVCKHISRSYECRSITLYDTNNPSEFDTQWRREIIHRSGKSGNVRKYIRSQSLSAFHQNKYSAGEIRLMRERLLRTHKAASHGSFMQLTRSQKLTLTSLALVDFISFCSMSIMAPFFPKEASAKGMSNAVSGFVFSFYALVIFISSPIFGKILPFVGAKFLFMAGMFVAGGCNILFGLLAHIESYVIFTSYCFLVRGMEALGASAYATASYVFVVDVFPDSIGTVLGILETFVGLGMSTGPAIGGLLYSVGGFQLPFYSLGVLMVVIVPVNLCLLPSSDACSMSKNSGSIRSLMKLPSVIIVSMVIVGVSNIWGFLDPTLEPHLRTFDLSPEKIGLIFLLFSALYGVFSPIWGWLADRANNHWSMMVCGLLLCTIGLLLLGPSPLFPFLKKTLWLNLLALSILGVSVALTLLPTFQSVLENAIEGGCRDEIGTYSMVAGIWSCMYSLGEVIGPSAGGLLVEHLGFPLSSTIMAGQTLIIALIALAFFSWKRRQQVSQEISTDSGISESWEEESSPLLPEHNSSSNDRIQYYGRLSRDDSTESDTRYSVAVTAGGACEV